MVPPLQVLVHAVRPAGRPAGLGCRGSGLGVVVRVLAPVGVEGRGGSGEAATLAGRVLAEPHDERAGEGRAGAAAAARDGPSVGQKRERTSGFVVFYFFKRKKTSLGIKGGISFHFMSAEVS